MSSSCRIIINADDFGLSSSVNEAVERAASDGILTSATLMANMPAFEEAVSIAKALPKLGVGVHLNILRGRPLTEPALIPSIIDDRGELLRSPLRVLRRIFLGQIDPRHIEAEFCAQIRKVREAGISPTHVDSEKHMHLISRAVARAASRAAAAFGITRMRIGRERLSTPGLSLKPTATQMAKAALISMLSGTMAGIASGYGLRYTDRFFGIALTGRMTPEAYAWAFGMFSSGTLEMMCHPAAREQAAEASGQTSWLDRQRIAEYRALLDAGLQQRLAEAGAKLINYGEL